MVATSFPRSNDKYACSRSSTLLATPTHNQAINLLYLFLDAASSINSTLNESTSSEDASVNRELVGAEEFRACAHCVVTLLRVASQEAVRWRRLKATGHLARTLECITSYPAIFDNLRRPLLEFGITSLLALLIADHARDAVSSVHVLEPALLTVCLLSKAPNIATHDQFAALVAGVAGLINQPTSKELQTAAARVIEDLTGTVSAQDVVAAAAIDSLIRACGSKEISERCRAHATRALATLASTPTTTCASMLTEAGGTQALLELVINETPSLVSSAADYALTGLANLAELAQAREVIVRNGGVPCLTDLICRNPSDGQRRCAGWILASVANDPDHGEETVAAGGLTGLIAYAGSSEDRQREEAAWAFANLSAHSLNAHAMSENAVIDAIVQLINEGNSPKVTLQAVWATANLAVHDSLKSCLAGRGAVKALLCQITKRLDEFKGLNEQSNADTHSLTRVSLTNTLEDVEIVSTIVEQAARGLANLADEPSNCNMIGGTSGIETLLRACQSSVFTSATSREAVVRALASLTAADQHVAKRFIDLGGVETLVRKLLQFPNSVRVQEQALRILLNLTHSHPTAVGNEQIIIQMVDMLKLSASPKIAEHSARVLCALCKGSLNNKIALMRNGGLRCLHGLLNATNVSIEVMDAASKAIKDLEQVLTPTSRRALVNAVLMPRSESDFAEARATGHGTGYGQPARLQKLASKGHVQRRSSPLAVMAKAQSER